MSTHDVFWMVWNPARNVPQVRHEMKHKAVAEAERLAYTYAHKIGRAWA